MARILIVDDERNMQTVLQLALESGGHEVRVAESGERAMKVLARDRDFDAVVSDLKMPGIDGIGLLRWMQDEGLDLPFILTTAYGTIEKAVEVMKLGAVEVLTKPFARDVLLAAVDRLGRLAPKTDEFVSVSAPMAEVRELIARVGPTAKTVLLTGESGTGKEVAARALHRHYAGGDFDRRPFVSINCPAMPEHLLESELFGHRKGSFTGADRDLRGRVEQAEGGTLFFDEIGDLPPAIQPKLLRLLENRTYEPLGTGVTREAQVRVVCATNRNLKKLVAEGRFREDLFYRINTFTLTLPPLRDRREDIPVLADVFLARSATELGKRLGGFEARALELMARHDWPGNVRELRNIVEHAAVMARGPQVRTADLPRDLTAPEPAPGRANQPGTGGPGPVWAASADLGAAHFGGRQTHNALEDQERRLIEEALRRHEGNVCAAARTLGVSRNTLRYRLAKYGG